MEPNNIQAESNPSSQPFRNPFLTNYKPNPFQNVVQPQNQNMNMSQSQQHQQHQYQNQRQSLPPFNNGNQVGNQGYPILQNPAQPQNFFPQNHVQPQNHGQPQNLFPQNQNLNQSQNQVRAQPIPVNGNPHGIFGSNICSTHHKPLNNICKARVCSQRLLCDTCVVEHSKGKESLHKNIVTMQEFLDSSLLYQLELYAKEEGSIFKPLDDRYHGVCSTISSSFEDLKAKITELLNQCEQKAKVKAKDYFLKPRPKKWVSLKNEYISTKEAYLKAKDKGVSKELDDLVQTINKVLQHKKEKEEDSLQEIIETQHQHMDKVLQQFKESISAMMESLFSGVQESGLKIGCQTLNYYKDVKIENKLMINSMVYVPKLDQIVTGSETGVIAGWSPITFDNLMSCKVHSDAINSLIYIEKEALLVTGSKDTSIKMFPVAPYGINTKKPILYTGHKGAVRSLLYLEGEDRVASAGEDPDIRIWSIRSGNLDTTIPTKGWKSSGDEMAFIRPERWIVVAGKKELRIYDYVTKELLITQGVVKAVGSMDYLLEKKLLIVQDDDAKITLFKVDGEKKKIQRERRLCLPASLKKPAYFKCFESSDLMLVSTGTNKVAVFALSTGGLLKEIETNLKSTTCISWLNNERRIIIGDSGSGLLGVLQY